MVHHLGAVKDDLNDLEFELDRQNDNSYSTFTMGTILARCIMHSTEALSAASELRFEQRQLNNALSSSSPNVQTARRLAMEIQNLSASFFYAVDQIDDGLLDISVRAEELPPPKKASSWWRRLVEWVNGAYRRRRDDHSRLMAAVGQTSYTRDTLKGILALQYELDSTAKLVLRLLDQYMEMRTESTSWQTLSQ
ncbi:hypothetical protein FRC07_010636 [Ceratobasidium sp. 392]|nr:hypothetical protein FRC07_010636 [Ceratobasidium sp. 392]